MKFKVSIKTLHNEHAFTSEAYSSEQEAFKRIGTLTEKLSQIQERLRA